MHAVYIRMRIATIKMIGWNRDDRWTSDGDDLEDGRSSREKPDDQSGKKPINSSVNVRDGCQVDL